MADEKKKIVVRDGDGDTEKMLMADEELARKMQEDWNSAEPSTSNNALGTANLKNGVNDKCDSYAQPYAPPPGLPPSMSKDASGAPAYTARISKPAHTNQVIVASKARAVHEQQMQNRLQQLQYRYQIYNTELEPEHEADYYCACDVHDYQRAKWARSDVQDNWNAAVLYPGEKAYNMNRRYNSNLFSGNPYQYKVISPYPPFSGTWGVKVPSSKLHEMFTKQTIALNNSLNQEAQRAIDAREPKVNIWDEKGDATEDGPSGIKVDDSASSNSAPAPKLSKMASIRKSFGIKSSEERQVHKTEKAANKGRQLRQTIIDEENGRWLDQQWRDIVQMYQEKTGMSKKIADLRNRYPIQYLHLLRAGYFEPIPVAWADQVSNPLKFAIEPASGWRGITPAWRGYEDTAEERLYWVLNHREGSTGTRLKPDFISALNMARERMDTAVPPPPEYYDANDVCHLEHTSDGYSKQVMPPPFKAFDRPEVPTDDTMILLDISGSMDFVPQSPNYERYLITGFRTSTQPKNKDIAKAIIRRFTDAMSNHDHSFTGYDLTTFSSQAHYVGTVNHQNLDALWSTIRIGGGTRVMTGWQKVKELHFQKHSESAIHHPVYGWQAGPDTPMLRLLLLLDGEATDMDEFELDLLGLKWAHVTIFLIGVDGCPHHHRHANELQRISDVNHHVSFVDAQGNTPERFVTHELLKRHLGYELSLQEFKELELPPTYLEATK